MVLIGAQGNGSEYIPLQSSAGFFDRWPAQQALRPHNAKSPKALNGTNGVAHTNGTNGVSQTNGTNDVSHTNGTNGVHGANGHA